MKETELPPELNGYTADPTEYLSADNEYRSIYSRMFSESLDRIKAALCAAPAFISAVKASLPRSELRAVLTPFQNRLLDERTVKMCVDKKGRLLALLRNAKNGQWAGHIELKEVMTTPDLLNAITDFSMQMQLAQISEQLHNIQKNIDDIRKGQHNDRIGEANACRQSLITAMYVSSPELRYQALISIAQNCETARQKIILDQKDILQLIDSQPEGFIGKLLNGISVEELDKKLDFLYDGINAVNIVSITEALAYSELGETEAAVRSLSVYNSFFHDTFMNPGLIHRLDMLSKHDDGFWTKTVEQLEKHIKALPGVDDILLIGETE